MGNGYGEQSHFNFKIFLSASERVQDDPKHATRTIHLSTFFMLGVFEKCKICMHESTVNTVKKFPCHAKLTFSKVGTV